eukprot:293422_1
MASVCSFWSFVATVICLIHLMFFGYDLYCNGIFSYTISSITTILQFIIIYILIAWHYRMANPYNSAFTFITRIIKHQEDQLFSCKNKSFSTQCQKVVSLCLCCILINIVALCSPILSIFLLHSKTIPLLRYALLHQLFFISVNVISCIIDFDNLSLYGHLYTFKTISAIIYLTIVTLKFNYNNIKTFDFCFIVHILNILWISLIILSVIYNRWQQFVLTFAVFNFLFPGIPAYELFLLKEYVDDYYQFVIINSKNNKEIMNKYYGAMGRLTEITYQKLNHSDSYNWIQQYKFIKLSLDGKISYLKQLDELYAESMELTEYECVCIVSAVIKYMFPILWMFYFWNVIVVLDYYYVIFFKSMMVLYVSYLLILLYFVVVSERILSNKMSYIRIRNIHQSVNICNKRTELNLTVESLKQDWYNMQFIEVVMDMFPQDIGVVIVSFLLTDLAPW